MLTLMSRFHWRKLRESMGISRIAALVVFASLLIGGRASAQAAAAEAPSPTNGRASGSGLQVSARLGFGGGVGDVVKGIAITDAAKYAVPVEVDVGFRLNDHWYGGVYGQYSFVAAKEYERTCPAGFDCSFADYRIGVAAEYHILPSRRFDPWVGLGFGYEWLKASTSGSLALPVGPGGALVPGKVQADVTDRGFEMANIQVGGDYRLSRWFSVGPALTLTYARYNVRSGSNTVTVGGMIMEQSLKASHANHGLILLTLRGTFRMD